MTCISSIRCACLFVRVFIWLSVSVYLISDCSIRVSSSNFSFTCMSLSMRFKWCPHLTYMHSTFYCELLVLEDLPYYTGVLVSSCSHNCIDSICITLCLIVVYDPVCVNIHTFSCVFNCAVVQWPKEIQIFQHLSIQVSVVLCVSIHLWLISECSLLWTHI